MDNKASQTSASGVRSFEVNGVRVIMKPAQNDVVSGILFISGGVSNYDLNTQGIENLTLNVMVDGGSKKFPKDEFHQKMESKGIVIGATSSFDYSTIELRSTATNWPLAWDLFSSVIAQPAWDEQSLDQVRGQLVAGLMQEQADPDQTIIDMSRTGIFKGQRYERKPEGTPEALEAMKLDDLKKHYARIMQRRKMVLVIVGKVNEADLKAKVQAAFSGLGEGKRDAFASNPPRIAQNAIDIQEREIATNYIRGVFPAPAMATRESVAMRIATSILSDRLFVEVRTKRNLSYAPSASISTLYDPYSSVYVSTTDPNQAVKVIMDEMKKVKTEGFSDKELRDKKEGFLTGYYMGQETNEGQASALGVSELRQGWQYAEKFKDEVRSLTIQEVNAAFKKYATAIHWFYLGDKSKVDEKIFKNF